VQNYELISDWGDGIYKDGNKAIKLFLNKSYEYVVKKAHIQSLVYNVGLPVPAVYDVKKISENEIVMEMDYIKGEPLIYENMERNKREEALKAMAKLQVMINAVDAADFGLPKYSEHIINEIKITPYLSDKIKDKVFDLFHLLNTEKPNLCHGDFHPGNVLFDGEKYWVIDWDGAGTGDPVVDACMTFFYEYRYMPSTADVYMREYCRHTGISHEDFLAWLPVVAAYNVNIKTKDERDYIMNVIRVYPKTKNYV
jgi:aminoglycoside phosphotransferase (APT) family kinase protein